MATQKIKVNVRGRTVTRTVPAAKKKVTKPALPRKGSADWFKALSKRAQADYIKAHPNSKYAKGSAASMSALKKELNTEQSHKFKIEAFKEDIERMKIMRAKYTRSHPKYAEIGERITKKREALKKLTAKAPAKKAAAPKAVKAVKAHDAKRAADKKKVVAKTPSATSKTKRASINNDIAYWKEELKKFKQVLKTAKNATSRARAERGIKRAQYQIKDLTKQLAGV
jgi:hypothetical protein